MLIATVCILVVCLTESVAARADMPTQLVFAALTLEQAASMVQAKEGGRVLGAETEKTGDREVHVIRLLSPDGSRVRHFRVDSKSGKISVGSER